MIYYVYPALSSFVRNDINGLSQKERVIHLTLNWSNKIATPFLFLRQFVHLVFHIWKTEAIICSFVGYHSFLPVIFGKIWRKKVMIVLNGTDSVGIAELNYGSHLKKILGWFCKFSLKHATELWPVSKDLISGSNSFTGKKIAYGVSVSFPAIKTPYVVIPNGFDFQKWSLRGEKRSSNSIISVVSAQSQFALKGIDLLIQFIQEYPEFQLTIVGMFAPNDFQGHSKIQFLGKLPQDNLAELFNEHEFYAQLSSFEGFGCSLCEAMLCGCIPIGSNVNAIPEIMNGTGILVEHKTVASLHQKIMKFNSETCNKSQQSIAARNAILTRYSLENRMLEMEKRL